MDKIFSVYLSEWDTPSEACASLWLPAQPYELMDAMDQVRLHDSEKLYLEIENYAGYEYLAPFLNGENNLYALNALAQRLSELDERQNTAFEGLLEMEVQKKDGPITILTLLNLAYSTDCCHVVESVINDEQLGRFYAENGFIPELDTIPDKVFEMLDFNGIGRKMRTGECGVFVPSGKVQLGGYVAQDSDLEQAPTDIMKPPSKPAYMMRFIFDKYNYDNPDNPLKQIILELPTNEENLNSALEQLAAFNWENVFIREYDGAFPKLIVSMDLIDGFDLLNILAEELRKLEQNGQLVKFKAVMAATGCSDLDTACELAERIDDYQLDAQISSPSEFAMEELRFLTTPKDADCIARHMNLHTFGKEALLRNHDAITPYGLVCRRDHQPLEDYQEQMEQSGGMEMR